MENPSLLSQYQPRIKNLAFCLKLRLVDLSEAERTAEIAHLRSIRASDVIEWFKTKSRKKGTRKVTEVKISGTQFTIPGLSNKRKPRTTKPKAKVAGFDLVDALKSQGIELPPELAAVAQNVGKRGRKRKTTK